MKSSNSANDNASSTELFPEITKKPAKAAPSSSGIKRIDCIIQTGRQWYQENVQIHGRDTIPDEEDLDTKIQQAIINDHKTRCNKEFMQGALEKMFEIIQTAIDIYFDSELSETEKLRFLKKTQDDIIAYLERLFDEKYHKCISHHIIRNCMAEVNTLEWTDMESLMKGVETLEKHFNQGY
ncbi:MAG: hypothetical protein ACRCZE_00230 [Candidatus Altimarinota bacterium]